MAVNDPQAVAFCNEKIRPLADVLEAAYRTASVVVADWFAQNVPAVLPSDGGQVYDGAEADGRPILQSPDVYNVITRAQELLADYDAAGGAKLNTVLKVAVNGQSRV